MDMPPQKPPLPGIVLTVQGKPRIGPLTSFRFFAAIGVVMYHFLRGPDSGFSANSRFYLLTTYGQLGVAFFFILSGYILTYNYAWTREKVQRLDQRNFWWKRFARIYPLYLFALLIDIPVTVIHSVHVHGVSGAAIRVVPTFLTNVLLLEAWNSRLFGGWNPPGWTLSAEGFFYLAFPFLVRKLGWIHDGGWRAAAAKSASLLALGTLVMGSADWGRAALVAENPRLHETIYLLSYNPLIYATLFFMGMMLCLAEGRIRREGIGVSRCLNVFSGVILLAGVADVVLNIEIPPGLRMAGACLFFGSLILLGGGGGPAWFSKALSLSPLLLLGEASYAVYLLQFPVFYYFEKLWAGLGMGEFDPSAHSNRLFYLFYLIALIGSSVLAFKFLEQPARSFLQGRLPWSWKPIQATASRFVPRP
jgi:peptidoglycan/LPS O-acetylase OafA/YrhL